MHLILKYLIPMKFALHVDGYLRNSDYLEKQQQKTKNGKRKGKMLKRNTRKQTARSFFEEGAEESDNDEDDGSLN